jgi:hypothetical protein
VDPVEQGDLSAELVPDRNSRLGDQVVALDASSTVMVPWATMAGVRTPAARTAGMTAASFRRSGMKTGERGIRRISVAPRRNTWFATPPGISVTSSGSTPWVAAIVLAAVRIGVIAASLWVGPVKAQWFSDGILGTCELIWILTWSVAGSSTRS